jgi:hypothetical protein
METKTQKIGPRAVLDARPPGPCSGAESRVQTIIFLAINLVTPSDEGLWYMKMTNADVPQIREQDLKLEAAD